MTRLSIVLGVATVATVAGSALATGPDITGTFNGIIPQVPITWSVTGGAFVNAGAAGCFNWTKTGGTYNGVSGTFDAFCLELTETVQEPNSYTYKVVPLAGGAAPDGDGQFTFPLSALQADQMSELFGRFRPTLNAADANACAAFQLAVWEIVYDPNLVLNGVGDSLQFGGGALGVLPQSQALLNAIDGTGPRMTLDAFTHPSVQDQVVPVPGTLALLGLGGLIAGRRRR
jgi:hypothetical protein